MNTIQKIIGRIFPPYKFKVQKKEWSSILNGLINHLPNDYKILKEQLQKTHLLDLSNWDVFPDFKFITIGYPGDTLKYFKKRGENYILSGLSIYLRKTNDFTNVELLIHDNCLEGIKIVNSNYEIQEFDLSRIECRKLHKTPVEFPKMEIDLFYEKLDISVKNKINPNDLFEIEFNNRTYFAFFDLGSGNCLVTDLKMNVFSFIHDANPMLKKLSYTLNEILIAIENKTFNIENHLEERYK